jgi:cyclic pyranopterin phosphate synthase
MKKLTHVDDKGKATMVDVGGKPVSYRVARASGHITLEAPTIRLINTNTLSKGDVLTVAQIAGINAAKQTSSLIPLCHNIVIDNVKVVAETDSTGVSVNSEVVCTGRTGVEMEALTAVSVALLTVYDMCKAVDKKMSIDFIRLDKKEKHEIA